MVLKARRQLLLALTTGLTLSSATRAAPDLEGVLDIGDSSGMGEWSTVYLLERDNPDAGVIAEAGRGSSVVVHSDGSTDQYYLVSVSTADGQKQRGYVWKPFVQITGVHAGVPAPGPEAARLEQPTLGREGMVELGSGPVHGKSADRDIDHTEGKSPAKDDAAREARFAAMQKKLDLLKSSYQTMVKPPAGPAPRSDEMVAKLEEQASQVVALEREVEQLSQGLEGTDERSKVVLKRLSSLQESVFNAVTAVAHLKTSHQRIARLEKAIFDKEFEAAPDPQGTAPDAMSAVHGVLEDRMKRIEAHFDELRDRVIEGEQTGTQDAGLRHDLERAMKSFARENEVLRTRLSRLEVAAAIEPGTTVAGGRKTPPVAGTAAASRLPSRPPLSELIAEVPVKQAPPAYTPDAPPAPATRRTRKDPLIGRTEHALAAAPTHRLPDGGAPRPPVDKAQSELELLKNKSRRVLTAIPKPKQEKKAAAEPAPMALASATSEPTARKKALQNPVVASYLNRIKELREIQAEQKKMVAPGREEGSDGEAGPRSLSEILTRIQELTRESEADALEAESIERAEHNVQAAEARSAPRNVRDIEHPTRRIALPDSNREMTARESAYIAGEEELRIEVSPEPKSTTSSKNARTVPTRSNEYPGSADASPFTATARSRATARTAPAPDGAARGSSSSPGSSAPQEFTPAQVRRLMSLRLD